MFTGIITDIGTVLALDKQGDLTARIGTAYQPDTIAIGASIACDGVCLTVTDKGHEAGQNWFEVQISAETLSKTNIGAEGSNAGWDSGRKINLERALKVGDELGGHIVSGHVDGVARVISIREEGDSTRVDIRAPEVLAPFIAPKGSVALNGTSLTVNDVDGVTFGVNLISHTKEVTTWGKICDGDSLNLEIDTLARYLKRLQEFAS